MMETMITETTNTDSFPETLSELLIPTNPALAREMATFHVNALLRCVLHALHDDAADPLVGTIAEQLASIEALLAG